MPGAASTGSSAWSAIGAGPAPTATSGNVVAGGRCGVVEHGAAGESTWTVPMSVRGGCDDGPGGNGRLRCGAPRRGWRSGGAGCSSGCDRRGGTRWRSAAAKGAVDQPPPEQVDGGVRGASGGGGAGARGGRTGSAAGDGHRLAAMPGRPYGLVADQLQLGLLAGFAAAAPEHRRGRSGSPNAPSAMAAGARLRRLPGSSSDAAVRRLRRTRFVIGSVGTRLERLQTLSGLAFGAGSFARPAGPQRFGQSSVPPAAARRCSSLTTPASASVLVSPRLRPSATSRNRRRMILPRPRLGQVGGDEDRLRLGDRADLVGDVIAQVVGRHCSPAPPRRIT